MAASAATIAASPPRRYGGEHHRLSVVDRLGGRIEQELETTGHDGLTRDPAFLRRALPLIDLWLAYFDAEVQGFDRVPVRGPALIVGNHSGGIYMPDFWAFLRRWLRERGCEPPLYSLGFDLMFAIPGMSTLARKIGTVPASHANASRLLERGDTVIVYPGGDEDDYRPWTERHRVDLHGRCGFVRLALRHQVPVVPMVSQGSHDVIHVVARGDALARRLGLNRLRLNILPFVAEPPWLVSSVPRPAKVTVRVCEPLDWRSWGPDAADDPVIVRHCYEEALGRMQTNLDELVAAQPHPLLARLSDPLRRGSRARHARP
jgi:1-acyl-sn-glycerol-3-phosphate acyltransferase